MSACSSQQYSQNVIINSEDALVKKEAELFFFDTNLSYEENEKISTLFSYRNINGIHTPFTHMIIYSKHLLRWM